MGVDIAPGTNNLMVEEVSGRIKKNEMAKKGHFFMVIYFHMSFFFRKNTKETGDFGENIAVRFLEKKGYRIIERNYTNTKGRRLGELDIIAKQGEEIVFIEVKTRKWEKDAPLPEESVTRVKLCRMEKIARAYLRREKKENAVYRFDVLSIFFKKENGEVLEIRHLDHVFL